MNDIEKNKKDNKSGHRETAIIKHSNQLAEVPLQNFTALEIKSFFAMCFFLQGHETNRVKISFDEFRDVTGYKRRGDQALVDMLWDMSFKFAKITLSEKKKAGFRIIVPFIDFEVDAAEKSFTVGVHEEFAATLNNLDGSPGKRFALSDAISISMMKSTYSMHCLSMLFLYRNKGAWYVSVDDLKYYLDIPAKHRTSEVNKILENVEREFREADLFEYFEITTRLDESPRKSTGRKKTLGYVFSFRFRSNMFNTRAGSENAEDDIMIMCPSCGKPLIKKDRRDGKGSFYGHIRGWEEAGSCRYTMSVEEAEAILNRKKVDEKVPADPSEVNVTVGELERYYRYIRTQNVLDAAERQDEIKEREPEIWEKRDLYEKKRRGLMDLIANFSFSDEGKKRKEEAHESVQEALDDVKRALVEKGYDADYLEPRFRCRECRDTGQRDDGTFCSCRAERVKEAAEWLKGQK